MEDDPRGFVGLPEAEPGGGPKPSGVNPGGGAASVRGIISSFSVVAEIGLAERGEEAIVFEAVGAVADANGVVRADLPFIDVAGVGGNLDIAGEVMGVFPIDRSVRGLKGRLLMTYRRQDLLGPFPYPLY